MTKTLRTVDIPATTLPVVDEADVVVVGGGTAGFVAAIAAARTGARAILVERWGYLAGCLTGGHAGRCAVQGNGVTRDLDLNALQQGGFP